MQLFPLLLVMAMAQPLRGKKILLELQPYGSYRSFELRYPGFTGWQIVHGPTPVQCAITFQQNRYGTKAFRFEGEKCWLMRGGMIGYGDELSFWK